MAVDFDYLISETSEGSEVGTFLKVDSSFVSLDSKVFVWMSSISIGGASLSK